MIIRPETSADSAAVRALTIAAFGRTVEADINDALHANGNALISLIASLDDAVVAHIMFSPVTIHDGDTTHRSVGLGPVAVAPPLHKQGIGSRLIHAGLNACQAAGYPHIFLLGHTSYYPRFGFQPASQYGIFYKPNVEIPSFMCLELAPNSLANVHGLLRFGAEFDIDT